VASFEALGRGETDEDGAFIPAEFPARPDRPAANATLVELQFYRDNVKLHITDYLIANAYIRKMVLAHTVSIRLSWAS
jgi:hypothetical protein